MTNQSLSLMHVTKQNQSHPSGARHHFAVSKVVKLGEDETQAQSREATRAILRGLEGFHSHICGPTTAISISMIVHPFPCDNMLTHGASWQETESLRISKPEYHPAILISHGTDSLVNG